MEHFLILGYPVPGWCSPSVAAAFPFPDLVQLMPGSSRSSGSTGSGEYSEYLTEQEIRLLTGNGFNMSQITALLLFAWGVARLEV